LSRRIDDLVAHYTMERAAAEERHACEIASLRSALTRQAKDHAAEAEVWCDELRLIANQLAEQRAVSRLRESRAGEAHDAQVKLRLVHRELQREAEGEESPANG
jgi:hypothetical protein